MTAWYDNWYQDKVMFKKVKLIYFINKLLSPNKVFVTYVYLIYLLLKIKATSNVPVPFWPALTGWVTAMQPLLSPSAPATLVWASCNIFV